MTPMIPALTAAGMIKVILSLLTTFDLISPEADTYRILDIIGDAAFYFMPIRFLTIGSFLRLLEEMLQFLKVF